MLVFLELRRRHEIYQNQSLQYVDYQRFYKDNSSREFARTGVPWPLASLRVPSTSRRNLLGSFGRWYITLVPSSWVVRDGCVGARVGRRLHPHDHARLRYSIPLMENLKTRNLHVFVIPLRTSTIIC